MNIHPALLPTFGGKALRREGARFRHSSRLQGQRMHRPLPRQRLRHRPDYPAAHLPVLDDDTAAALAHRVFEEEKIAYPEAIRLFQQGRLRVEGRRVRIMLSPRPTTS
jgi:phosphoribosylglycinamide formyltransferase-1